ncbi:MAG: VTT domain-containing protein [Desulfuromonadaceae bacterium]|nr:VTT domain-containing protein [Desulfuromonadaceae bacterium]
MEHPHQIESEAGVADSLKQIADTCNSCGLCVRSCAFLTRHKSPALIAHAAMESGEYAIAFECSLCGLCDTLCPHSLQIKNMFLHMRRLEAKHNPTVLKRFKGLRSYVSMGRSKWLQSYALPQGCTQVFFPGCALPGTRANLAWKVYTYLTQRVPALGLVLDCCAKPYHDIGMQTDFAEHISDLGYKLEQHGITKVITACPNCYEVFKRYLPQVEVTSVYELLTANILEDTEDKDSAENSLQVTVHDPCVNRFRASTQNSVRTLIKHAGMEVREMKNHAETTICCGEGGCVIATDPELALSWRRQRVHQSDGLPVVTYCAGCVEYLSADMPTFHVLDLLDTSSSTDIKPVPPTRGLKRYLDRFNLKRKAEKHMRTQTDASDDMVNSTPATKNKGSIWGRFVLLTVLVAAIAALKISGGSAWLEPERLQGLISGYGYWAPFIYILLYAAAPVLFMPGLPLTILGGMLFGPVWGVVYTIIGATSGACVAFLVARYLGREWISTKMSGPRWQKLDADVAHHGWKIVALTRLIPLFPFNLLNYAFGVTRIPFLHYALTSFVCMLPATIAYVYLSSSVGQLFKGELSMEFGIGLGLIVLLSLLPLGWRRYAKGRTLRIDE